MCVFGSWRDCPGHQMAGCGGRYGLSLSHLQPPGCAPQCPTDLPRGSFAILSGLVGEALAIGISRVGGALVFWFWDAAFSCWTLRSDVLGPWCWEPGWPGHPVQRPQIASPGAWTTRPGMILRAIRCDKVSNFHIGFTSMFASVPLW